MDFIGRKKEVAAINSLLKRPGYQGAIIYGRRRLGKTELLKHCLLDKGIQTIYYQCNQESERSNTDDLTLAIEESLGLSNLSFESFSEAIRFVFERSRKKETYLAIDEYPYIRKLSPGLDSKLQKVIDDYESTAKIKFFLSGSSISTMEDIIGENNPLYRRFMLSLLLKEMDYYDSSLFYPSFSNEDKVKLYAAFGGVPFYNKQINPSLSVKSNIIDLLSGRFSHLAEETSTNLKTELAKVNSANAVFSAIADGAFHYSDILSKSHINSSPSLSDVLDKLQKMDLIEYVSPINEKKNKTKSGYRISDAASRFYYRYIFHNLSARNILDEEAFYDLLIKDDFDSHLVPSVYEAIAKQFLARMNRLGKLSPVLLDIGTYWYDDAKKKQNGQFDVVGQAKEGYVFYEAKFTSSKVDDRMIKEEAEQVQRTSLRPIQLGFISRSGFSLKEKYPYQFFTLDEMYAEDLY